jgi:hypothetical protein
MPRRPMPPSHALIATLHRSSRPFVVELDLGTTNCNAIVVDPDGLGRSPW